MKKTILALAVLLFSGFALFAQTSSFRGAPAAFNYQGVARNATGVPMANTTISLRVSLFQGISGGTTLYQEVFASVTTNTFGLFNIQVGTGVVQAPHGPGYFDTIISSYLDQSAIYMEVEVDPSGSATFWTSLGRTQLQSVPFALYAANGPQGPAGPAGPQGIQGLTGAAGSGSVLTVNTAAGELTGGPITTTGTLGLADVGIAGTYGSATTVPVITTDAFGRVTNVVNTAIPTGTGTVTSVGTIPGELTGGPITNVGNIGLATAGTAGTYGSATVVPVITTDIFGRVTSIVNTPITSSGVGTVTSITATAPLTGGTITGAGSIGLGTIGTAGTYGSATLVPIITTDAYGRVTTVTTAPVTATTVTMGGDVTGLSSACTVGKLQGNAVSPTAPTTGDVLQWTGAAWTPTLGGGGGVTSTGTTNYISMFTSATNVGNSGMYQDPGTGDVGLNTTLPGATLDVEAGTSDDNTAIINDANVTAPSIAVLQGNYTGPDNFDQSVGVSGTAQPVLTTAIGIGVQGYGGTTGVLGTAENEDFSGLAQAIGVEGLSEMDGNISCGVAGFGQVFFGLPNYEYGVYASTDLGGIVNYAGWFDGDVNVVGTLSKGGGSFKIDDPLDPANKYLYHSFVESPDMMNIYNGNVTTDASGVATITLPDYFSTLNKDYRYQLTVMGETFAQAIVSKKISGNSFEIKTNLPNIEVSWQVTGIRQDPFANAHRIIPEVEKKSFEKGKYLYPELYGKSKDLKIGAMKPSVVKKPAKKPAKSAGESNGLKK